MATSLRTHRPGSGAEHDEISDLPEPDLNGRYEGVLESGWAGLGDPSLTGSTPGALMRIR